MSPPSATCRTAGVLELVTCCATHGFLPLVSTEEARRAQVLAALANHEKHFGQKPRGIWLPECAYAPGLEKYLAGTGLEYFVADTHAVLYGEPRPRYGAHSPVLTPSGVAVFARDPETSRQVWSAEGGYPGDPFYREFYRDLGFDAPHEYLLPHLHRDGARRHLGLKYHRVTGRDVPLRDKQPYDPDRARERAAEHARHFVHERLRQARRLRDSFGDGRAPHVVAPYDAELFGHWWFEGLQFLELVFRELHAPGLRGDIELITPGDFLDLGLPLQTQRPAQSSWGAGGYFAVWLNEKTSWMYPHQHAAEARMTALARRFRRAPDPLTRRALAQAARELLLLQSSDWAFQISHDTTAAYAARRFRTHLRRFHALADDLDRGRSTNNVSQTSKRTTTSLPNSTTLSIVRHEPRHTLNMTRDAQTFPTTTPLIIGHRGASALAPENTLVAFERALADGADGVEFDVRLARDRVPVVIHDATLRRTLLRDETVAALTSSELQRWDAGLGSPSASPNAPATTTTSRASPRSTRRFSLSARAPQPSTSR